MPIAEYRKNFTRNKPKDLTPRQHGVLRCMLVNWLRGYIPTTRDLMLELNISSPNGVMGHVTALRRKGYVVNKPNCGFRLTDKALDLVL